MTEKDQLEIAITAIRRGELDQGRKVLVNLLKLNSKNELAWLWLARSFPDIKQRMVALEQCLKAIPNSQTARRALQNLRSKQTTSAARAPVKKSAELQQDKTPETAAAKPTPLNDRLAKVERTAPDIHSAEIPQPAQSNSSRLPASPAAIRVSKRAVQPAQKTSSRSIILFTFELLLGIFMLVVITTGGWIALETIRTHQENLAQQALASTTAAHNTQEAALLQENSLRQTQTALQPTSTKTPLPATRTPRPTPTLTATPTPVPTLAGSVSMIGPENVSSLAQSNSIPGSFYAALAFSPDGSLLVGASSQGIAIWETQSFQRINQIFLENDAEAVAFSPDGTILYFSQAGEDNKSYLYSADTAQFQLKLTGIEFPASTVNLFTTTDGKSIVLASFTSSANISLVNPENGEIEFTLDHTGGLLTASLNPHSNLLATAGYNALIQIWDLDKQQIQTVLSGHTSTVTSLGFSLDGALLASASQDGVIKLWNAENWKLISTLGENNLPVTVLAFSPDHRLLFSADADGQTTAWDTATSAVIKTFPTAPGLKDMQFSLDGAYLAMAESDSVEIWALPTP